MVNVAIHFVRAGAFFFGVRKNSGTLKAKLFDEVEKLLEIFFCLAWETYNECCSNAQIRNALAHATQQVADVVAGGHTFHGGQHAIGNVLQGDVDIFCHLITLGDGFDQLIAPVSWMSVKQADPEFAGDFA